MDSNAFDLRKCRRIKWWWNFVGRTDEETRKARDGCIASDRFGEVKGYDGARLDAPGVLSHTEIIPHERS
ncbi:hypothetical protein [Streptomyces sp. NPDC003863]